MRVERGTTYQVASIATLLLNTTVLLINFLKLQITMYSNWAQYVEVIKEQKRNHAMQVENDNINLYYQCRCLQICCFGKIGSTCTQTL